MFCTCWWLAVLVLTQRKTFIRFQDGTYQAIHPLNSTDNGRVVRTPAEIPLPGVYPEHHLPPAAPDPKSWPASLGATHHPPALRHTLHITRTLPTTLRVLINAVRPTGTPTISISGEDWETLSPEARIQQHGDHKWGWVIYRCSYAKEFDGGWDDLKRRIARMRESIVTNSDAPGIAKTMDFIFVEDPALEGASVTELQRRFQAWARADNQTPGFDMDECTGSTTRGSRYEFFLRVDGESLWGGYIGLVRGWPCDPGSEDWMKIRVSSVGTELYEQLDNADVWYTPPEFGVSDCGW